MHALSKNNVKRAGKIRSLPDGKCPTRRGSGALFSFDESADGVRLRSAVRVPPRRIGRIFPIFSKSKTSAGPACRSPRAALRFAPRICTGRAVTVPARYRSQKGLPEQISRDSHELFCGAGDRRRRRKVCGTSNERGTCLRRLKGPVP